MRRIVLDTNVLVGGAYDDLSASRQIIDACTRGELTAVMSPAVRKEYEKILQEAVRIRGYEERMRLFLATAEVVRPAETPAVVPDDPEDDKIIAAAVTGRADVIITNDRHLLDLDPYEGIRIMRPATFEHGQKEADGGTWDELARTIGLIR